MVIPIPACSLRSSIPSMSARAGGIGNFLNSSGWVMCPWTSMITASLRRRLGPVAIERPGVVGHPREPFLVREDRGHVEVAEALRLGRGEHRIGGLRHRQG